jgi:catechol 2,3-dioxygenase-like lactoylglutathione lyase family enzyme
VSHIRRFDHVGITVADLEAVMAFFVGLGLEIEGRTFMEGEFVDTVIGIPGSRSHIVMPRPPGGRCWAGALELRAAGTRARVARRHVQRTAAAWSTAACKSSTSNDGYGLVGGIGQYVRGAQPRAARRRRWGPIERRLVEKASY